MISHSTFACETVVMGPQRQAGMGFSFCPRAYL